MVHGEVSLFADAPSVICSGPAVLCVYTAGPYPGSEACSNAAFPEVAPDVYHLTFIPPFPRGSEAVGGGPIDIANELLRVRSYVSL